MRRLYRPALDDATSAYLAQKQAELNAQSDPRIAVNDAWKCARRCLEFIAIEFALKKMNGDHQQCMYCVTSKGGQIEHIFPKARYTEKTFDWENYLLVCGDCNASKGARFPLDSAGAPLLLDPSKEDPRPHLPYSPSMGLYVTDEASEKGRTSINILKLNQEYLQKKRKLAWNNVHRILKEFRDAHFDPKLGDEAVALADLQDPELLDMLQELIYLSRLDEGAFSDEIHSALHLLLARADVDEYWCEPE